MDILAAVVLGIIQGLTEFLPISSTGHLVVAQQLLGVSPEKFGLTFDVALHVGTAFAVLIYFWQTWLRLLSNSFKPGNRAGQNIDRKLLVALFVGTIPAGLFGLLFGDQIESAFRSPLVVACALLFGSALFYVAEKVGTYRKNIETISIPDGFLIGCSQAVALIPGISRSGITISAGLLRGFTRDTAARFAFLLSTPVIAGAALAKFVPIYLDQTQVIDWQLFSVGVATSFITGFITIVYFLRFLKTHTLQTFIWYRVVLAAVVFVMYFTGVVR